jgi:hypothetical protein
MLLRLAGAIAGLLLGAFFGCVPGGEVGGMSYVAPEDLSAEWRTKAERTGYVETDRYDAVVDYCRRLAQASPRAQLTSFGRTGAGRELPLLVLSRDGVFAPEAAREAGRLVVLLQNCIHAGECAGKDASLELARDILITGVHRDLLDEVTLLIMPVFNADGHERFSAYSRINQNGPKEMGWRVTATNLNLNRDYTKADAVEMQAWLRTWVAWEPDLLFDNHTTNGSDHQYVLLYSAVANELTAAPVAEWLQETLFPSILPALEVAGHGPFPYGGPRDRRDLSKGIGTFAAPSPRFSHGYGAICNRPTILVEAHALKTYRQRVWATYDIMLHTLKELNRRPELLHTANRQADLNARAWRGARQAGGEVVLALEPTDDSVPITYKAVEFDVRESEITGREVIDYSDRPVEVQTRLFTGTRVTQSVAPPAAYLVPPQWAEAIERLELHGVEFFRLARSEQLDVESYRFEEVEFARRPFESRLRPSYKAVATRERRDFAAGTVVVPLDQKRAKLAVHLLEPDAPDALVAWGFFNAIFEQKEYTETYAMEPIARRMLAADPELKREFEERLQTDEEFAKSPRARLYFFYRRSPYWDERLNEYPVARLADPETADRLGRERRAPGW